MLIRQMIVASAVALTAVLAGPALAEEGKTRAQVQAELADAVRNGDMLADVESGQKLNQRYPTLYTQGRDAAERAAGAPVRDTAHAGDAAQPAAGVGKQPEGAVAN